MRPLLSLGNQNSFNNNRKILYTEQGLNKLE